MALSHFIRGKADIVQHNRDGQPIYVSLSYSYPYIVCVVDKEPGWY